MDTLEKVFKKVVEIQVKLKGFSIGDENYEDLIYEEDEEHKSSTLIEFVLETVKNFNKVDKSQLDKKDSSFEVRHYFKTPNGRKSGFFSIIQINEAFYRKSEGEQVVHLQEEFKKILLNNNNNIENKTQWIREDIKDLFKQLNEEQFQYNFSGGFDVKTKNNATYSFLFEDRSVVILKNEQKVIKLNELGKLLEGFYSGKLNTVFDLEVNGNCKQSFFGWLYQNGNQISIHKNLFNQEGILYHKLHNVRLNILNEIEENDLGIEDYMFTLNAFIDFLQEKWKIVVDNKKDLISFIESV